LLLAFLRGSQRDEAGLTITMRRLIDDEIAVNADAITGMADDIYAGKFQPDALGEEGARNRIALWVGTAGLMYAMGQLHQDGAPHLQWVLGPTEHCTDCLRLSGQVHTAEEWQASGWTPKGRNLECHGYRCQCSLVGASGPSRGSF
jgi:hypothetical protein